MRTLIVGCILFMAVEAHAQTVAATERLAALEFARNNGFEITPATIVVRETVADSSRPGPRPSTLEAHKAEASSLAQAVGPEASVGSVLDLLECRNFICAGKTSHSVLLLSAPAKSGESTVVRAELYGLREQAGELQQMLTVALITVERSGGGWTGVGYNIRPITTRPRVPPPQ